MAVVWVVASVAARATTRVTGSFFAWPNSTGSVRRTQLRAVWWTASLGRAWAKAKPGATTI